MSRRTLLSALYTVLCIALLIAMIVAARAQTDPVTLIVELDGEVVGTLAPGGFEYRLAENRLVIETNELVTGCAQSRVFRDRFEP